MKVHKRENKSKSDISIDLQCSAWSVGRLLQAAETLLAANIKRALWRQLHICGSRTETLPLTLSTCLALFRSSLLWFQLHHVLLCICLAHKCTRLPSVPWLFLLAASMMKIGTFHPAMLSQATLADNPPSWTQSSGFVSFVKNTQLNAHFQKIRLRSPKCRNSIKVCHFWT